MGRWYDGYKARRIVAIEEIISGEKYRASGRKPGDELSEAFIFLDENVKAYLDEIYTKCSTAPIIWVEFYKEYRDDEISFVDTCISENEEYLKKSVSSRVLSLAVEFAHRADDRLMADEIPDGKGARWRFAMRTQDVAIDKIIAGKKDGSPRQKSKGEVSEALTFLDENVKAYLDEIEKVCPTATVMWIEFYKKYRTNPGRTLVDTSISTKEEYEKKMVSDRVLSLAVELAHTVDDRLMAEEIPDGESARWRFAMRIKVVEKK